MFDTILPPQETTTKASQTNQVVSTTGTRLCVTTSPAETMRSLALSLASLFLGLLFVPAHPAFPKYPVPTPDILQWSQQEIGVLIHFNMETYLDHMGCDALSDQEVPDAKLFNPYVLTPDNWALAMLALGAKYAVLVGKHECGFTLWPTAATLPVKGGGSMPYNYSVQYSSQPTFDVVGSFVRSCESFGIRTGYYYALGANFFLNVANGQVKA